MEAHVAGGANFFCKIIDKINGDPKAAKTVSFYCTVKAEEGYVQVGLKAPAEGFEKYIHKAYLHRCTVRQFIMDRRERRPDRDENGDDCSRVFEDDATATWADVMRKANRIGESFRGIVSLQGKLGIRYVTKATGDHQEILLPEKQQIPKELYEVTRWAPPWSKQKSLIFPQ